MNNLILLSLLAFMGDVNSILTTGCQNTKSIIHNSVKLDLNSYMGIWYEQAHNKNNFCYDKRLCSMSNYSSNLDGSISIRNSYNLNSADSRITLSEGRATILDLNYTGYQSNSFGFPFFNTQNAIVAVDYSKYAIIINCPKYFGSGFVWILTRERQPNIELVDYLLNLTTNIGFSRVNLVKTYQGTDCNYPIY